MVKKIQINLSNRLHYTLILIGIIIISSWIVIAFVTDGSGNPSIVGHSGSEIDLSEGVNTPAVFNDNVTMNNPVKINDALEVNGEMRIASTGRLCDSTGIGFLKYNGSDFYGCDGTSWSSLTGGIAGSSSSNDLVNGFHSSSQCTAAGGTVYDTGAGSLCRFSSSSCTGSWAQYNSWTTTTPNTCAAPCGGGFGGATCSPCTTDNHGFSNTARETCSYWTTCSYDSEAGSCQNYGYNNWASCPATITQVGCY